MAYDRMPREDSERTPEKTIADILEHFVELERQHLRKLKIIRIQGYMMQAAIITIVLLFALWPFCSHYGE